MPAHRLKIPRPLAALSNRDVRILRLPSKIWRHPGHPTSLGRLA